MINLITIIFYCFGIDCSIGLGQEVQDTVLSSLLGTIMGDWKPAEPLKPSGGEPAWEWQHEWEWQSDWEWLVNWEWQQLWERIFKCLGHIVTVHITSFIADKRH